MVLLGHCKFHKTVHERKGLDWSHPLLLMVKVINNHLSFLITCKRSIRHIEELGMMTEVYKLLMFKANHRKEIKGK